MTQGKLSPKVAALMTAALAAPKTHKVVTTYADGAVREFETRSLQTAENHAVLDRRNIGRDMLERGTDRKIRIVKVEVVEIVPLRTVDDVRKTLAEDKQKGNDTDKAMARLMLRHGRLTPEARAFVESYLK